ncbi:hypothetical protein LY15_002772 [Prauserella flava]|nr:hypothetical protein [Prauserella flava]MCR3735134.1 hypothetical protein [Prauserella salsuginis]
MRPQPRQRKSSWLRSAWAKVRAGFTWTRAAVVGVLTLVATTATIPGAYPWLHDNARDLFGEEALTTEGEAKPDLLAGAYWATDEVVTASADWRVFDRISSSGAQMGTSGHIVKLHSNRAARIVIEGLTAVVEQRREPLSGTAYLADPQGGDMEALLVDIPLDRGGREVPALVRRDGGQPRPYGVDGKIRYLEQGVAEQLLIKASTENCHCTWRLRIDYSYRGETGQVVVPPRGQPAFETTAWTRHKVEYDMHSAEDRVPRRHDCVRDPHSCRREP